MGRSPCCAKEGLNKGAWTATEDKILVSFIKNHGEGKWRSVPKKAGLKRCGKSCRLRWLNYLRPDIKRGNISDDEEELIIRLHKLLGNRWSLIAGRLPGRTDNEIKNYWNTKLSKRVPSQSQPSKQRPIKSKSHKPRIEPPSVKAPPMPPGVQPNIIRTKAFKCSNGFVATQQTVRPIQDTIQAVDSVAMKSGAPPNDEPFDDLMIDFDDGDPYMSNPLDTDFIPACDDDVIAKTHHNNGSSQRLDHPLLPDEPLIEDWTGSDDGLQPYDFRLLASFLNLENEWP